MREFYDVEGKRLPVKVVDELGREPSGKDPRNRLVSILFVALNALGLVGLASLFSFSPLVQLLAAGAIALFASECIDELFGLSKDPARFGPLSGIFLVLLGTAALVEAALAYPIHAQGSVRIVPAAFGLLFTAGGVRRVRLAAVETDPSAATHPPL